VGGKTASITLIFIDKIIINRWGFLNSGKDLTWGDLDRGVYKIPCSCGKFYIGRTNLQFIEHRNSLEKL